MNILVVSQIFYPTPFRINDVVQAWQDAGHTVRVITGLPDYGLPTIPKAYRWGRRRRTHDCGATVNRVMTTARRSGVFWRTLNYLSFAVSGWLYASLGRFDDVDVIFVYETSPIFQVIPARRLKHRLKCPMVLYTLDLWPESLKAWRVPETHPIYRWTTRISRQLYQSADWVPVTSPAFVDYLQDLAHISAERMPVIPQYAEALFDAVSGIYEPHDGFHFVYAGNIGAAQGVESLIQAIPHMKHPAQIHIVGGGSALPAVQALAAAHQVTDRVRFYGQRPLADMPDFYRKADAFILLLAADGAIARTIPGKLQSYMAAGKPIVAAADGAAADIIRTADCGQVCPPDDLQALAQAMDRLVADRATSRRMGEQAARYARSHYDRAVVLRQLTAVLESAVLSSE